MRLGPRAVAALLAPALLLVTLLLAIPVLFLFRYLTADESADYLAITGHTLSLPASVQKNWKWCNKCQSLTYAGHPAARSARAPCSD